MASKFSRKFRFFLICAGILTVFIIISIALFSINGLLLANNETPVTGMTSQGVLLKHKSLDFETIKILSYNIAKGFIYNGGINFEKPEIIKNRLQKIADIINKEQPDLVFLSEIVFQCDPCPVNQVTWLAEATGMAKWVFGENYNFGLPFYRIVGGNAILSRWPDIAPKINLTLAGRKPFYETRNSRRLLWCELRFENENILLGSVHNDSFNQKNNLAQTRQMLNYINGQPTVIAGDFNVRPDTESIRIIKESNLFTGSINGPETFPSHKPDRKIDYIFAPKGWKKIKHYVIESEVSDHLPIVTVFGRRG